MNIKMVKVKFKKVKELGVVNFLGKKPIKRKIKPVIKGSVSILSPSMKRPAAKFYGDYDGDGVMNGLDCEPRNKLKQGPMHKRRKGISDTDFIKLRDFDEQTERELVAIKKKKVINLYPAREINEFTGEYTRAIQRCPKCMARMTSGKCPNCDEDFDDE